MEELKPGCIRLNATATGFREDAECVALDLAGGERVSGDLLNGADGIKSAVRRQIAGENRPRYTGDSAWRLTVPVERLPPHFLDGKSSIRVGPGKRALVYFLRAGALLNFVGAVELEDRIEESWTRKRPWDELRADFEARHPDILTIVDAADRGACFRWAMDEAGSIPDAPALYEGHRKPRARRVVDESRDNRRLFHPHSETAPRAAFAKRNMDRERSDWLYSYNPLTVELCWSAESGAA